MTYELTDAEVKLREQRAKEETEAKAKRDAEEAQLSMSWEPIDLTAALSGQRESRPELLERTDGKHLIYAGKMHWIMGEPESMKSFMAQLATAQVIEAGLDVVYLDYEDTEFGVVERLLAMGVEAQAISDHLSYIRPDTQIGSGRERITAAEARFMETLDARHYTLAVLDGVTESVALEGLDLNDNTDIADWLQRIPKRMARTGAACIVIDHVTKAVDGRGRYALGGGHKLAGLDGVSYTVEVIAPLSRAEHEAVTGKARIIVGKDRPGWVRSVSKERKYPGTLEVTAWPDGTLTAAITNDVIEPQPPMEVIADVLRVLNTFGGEDSEGHLVKHCDHPEAAIVEAVRWLLDKQWVEADKKGNSTIYRVTTKGSIEMGE